jgi:hypothetical protein
VYLAIAGMSFVFDAALVTVHILDQQIAIFAIARMCAVLCCVLELEARFCGAMNVIAYDAISTQELDEMLLTAVVALRTDLQQNRRTG